MQIQFLSAGELNDVDTHTVDGMVVGVASNRTDGTLKHLFLDPTARVLAAASSTAIGFGPYGVSRHVSPSDGGQYAFVMQSTRTSGQFELTVGTAVTGRKVRDMSTSSESEGCVARDASKSVFVAQEDMGIYRYSAEPTGGTSRIIVDLVSGPNLAADAEGLTIAYTPTGNYLVASSQVDSRFAAYDLAAPYAHRAQLLVGANGTIDGVSGTDGVAVATVPMGPRYPSGLIVVHDTANAVAGATSTSSPRRLPRGSRPLRPARRGSSRPTGPTPTRWPRRTLRARRSR